LRTESRIPAGSGTRRPTGEREAIAGRRVPDGIREGIARPALDETEPSPRELAARVTDAEKHSVSEASVHRILKAHDLIASPAFVVIKASDGFRNKTTRPNRMVPRGDRPQSPAG
jgi:hypothetical protein